jgi:RNA polymerase sigma-70 factor (ECF subfamily)
MDSKSANQDISQITTIWDQIRNACGGVKPIDRDAVAAVMNRYHGAVYRYLLGALRDQDAAEELFQEFALRFLRGDLRGANPERGRFREYLKGVLRHLVADYTRKRQRQPRLLNDPGPGCDPPAGAEEDRVFLQAWRDELLAHTWEALAEADRQTGSSCYTVLRLRTEHPEWQTSEMAEQLAQQLGKAVSDQATRQMLYLARRQFADLLVREVQRSLGRSRPGKLEEELSDLGLLDYCRPALKRRDQQQ